MNALDLVGRVGRVAFALVLVAFVAVFVVVAVPSVVGAEHSYVVLSNSMAPEIQPGDVVIVGNVAPENVQEGDVITFDREADQPPVTHRVREVMSDEQGVAWRTAGDNQADGEADPWTVRPDDLVGQVWFTIPLVGYVVQFGNTTAGAAVLIGVPIALLALSELWARAGETTITRADSSTDVDDPVIPTFDDPDADEIAGDVDESGGGVTIGANELRLGALGFGTFTIYASYIALQTPNGLTVGVAVGAGVAAAFHVGGLVLLALAGRSDTDRAGDGDTASYGEELAGGRADD